MEQTGLTMQEGITSISNLQRRTTLMRSRLLSTAAAMFLLLGLIAGNAFAQITDASAVKFSVRKTTSDVWRTTSANEDTVGRPTNLKVEFSIGQQTENISKYLVTLPVGTATDSALIENNGVTLSYTLSGGGVITDILTAAQIAIVNVNEPDAGVYSSTKQPSLLLTAPRDVTSNAAIAITISAGLYNGSTLSASNSHGLANADEQANTYFGLVVVDTPTDTIAQTDSFFLKNDLADGVVTNSSIGAILSGNVLSNSDSIGVVDRFGNYVPDFFDSSADSLKIFVSDAQGDFSLTGDGGTLLVTAAGASRTLVGDSIVAITDNGGNYNTGTPATTWAGALVTVATDFAVVNVSDASANNADENDDLKHIPLWLGDSNVSAAGNYNVGITFTKDADMAVGDSVSLVFSVTGDTATGTYLNVAADHQTTVKRVLQASTDSKLIGTIAVADAGDGDYYVGETITLNVTVKNLFGDAFSGATIGSTSLDSLSIAFEYSESSTINATTTGLLQSGQQVTSTKSQPAAMAISASKIAGSTIYSSAASSGAGVVAVPFQYLGMSTHTAKDSLAIIITAKTNGKADTVKVNIEPSAPVYFDTDSLVAYLALDSIVPVKGLPVSSDLPIFALDTAYNRVANLTLSSATGFLDAIAIQSTGGANIKALNFLIDGRDPKGHGSTTVKDSISFDFSTIARAAAYAAGTLDKDSSFIGNTLLHANSSDDSSRINLGGLGDDPLGMSLKYTGNNRRVSVVFDPATLGSGFTFNSRTQDLALINLVDVSVVDSLSSLTVVSTGHKAGRTDTLIVSASLPVASNGDSANVLDQNSADSLIILTLESFGDAAGLPAGLTTANVAVSADNITYYNATGVMQGDGDSIAFVTPITFNATSTAQTMYVKVMGMINPTIADSANLYKVKLATSTTAIFATEAMSMVDDTLAQYMLVSPTAGQDSVRAGVKWLSDITAGIAVDTLTVGDTAWFQVAQADQYGNTITGTRGANLGNKLLLTSVEPVDTTKSLVLLQKHEDAITAGAGVHAGDSLTVKIDSVKSGTSTSGYFADSVGIIAVSTNSGVDYDLVLSDVTGAVISSTVKVYVKAGAANAIALDPDTLVTADCGAKLPTLTATLTDSYGNALVGGTVSFGLASGVTTDAAFADTNGTDLAVGVDTVAISTDASGKAMATWLAAGTGDSVAIAVWATGVSAVYYSAKTQFTGASGAIRIVSPTDSLVPSLTDAGTIVANVLDADLVTAVYANVWRSNLTAGTDGVLVTSDAVAFDSVVGVAVASADSAQVSLVLPDTVAVDTATVIKYQLVMVDAVDSVTYSDTMMYVVGPTRGKRDMTANAVNVADVMRLVYLIAIDEIVPTIVDYMGLDLDQDGSFDTPDLTAELAIWKGTGTSLAGAASLENATAKAALSYEATDKASANLALNLESSHNMNVAVFRIKYDTEKFVFGEAKATDRLKNISVVSGNNDKDGVYTVVLVNTEGGQILQGSGAVLNIDISAAGDKFDGVGEISLLNASFDEGVAAELSREVLSPKALLPKAFALSQNYPNPFNPSTTIAYDVPEGDNVQVQLNVYNMRGQLVKTLVNDAKGEGSYQVQWDGSDNYGRRVSSGIFFYRIKAGEFSKTRKMVILK
jgi:hypothetical protein